MNKNIMTEEDLWLKRFGKNLQSLIPKDMSISEFSKRCGLSPSAINSYISGENCPMAWSVIKIARALGRPITDVIDFFY